MEENKITKITNGELTIGSVIPKETKLYWIWVDPSDRSGMDFTWLPNGVEILGVSKTDERYYDVLVHNSDGSTTGSIIYIDDIVGIFDSKEERDNAVKQESNIPQLTQINQQIEKLEKELSKLKYIRQLNLDKLREKYRKTI